MKTKLFNVSVGFTGDDIDPDGELTEESRKTLVMKMNSDLKDDLLEQQIYWHNDKAVTVLDVCGRDNDLLKTQIMNHKQSIYKDFENGEYGSFVFYKENLDIGGGAL